MTLSPNLSTCVVLRRYCAGQQLFPRKWLASERSSIRYDMEPINPRQFAGHTRLKIPRRTLLQLQRLRRPIGKGEISQDVCSLEHRDTVLVQEGGYTQEGCGASRGRGTGM